MAHQLDFVHCQLKTRSSKNTHFGDWLLFPPSFTKGRQNQLSWILRH